MNYLTCQTSDDCTIAYKLYRTAKPNPPRLVLIHSLALDASIWDRVVANLSREFEILTYDCRGHGHSNRRVTSYTAELFARDLAELLDHVGWQNAIVAGCSMGGCVAQAFGGLYPSRVTALALMDTTAWYGNEAAREWRDRAANAVAKGLASLVDFQVTRWFGEQFRSAHPELVKATVNVFMANDLDCYAASCALLGDADLRSYLPNLKVPVAVVVGEEDYATPIPFAQHLHEAIADSTLTIIPGARHLTPIECPDEIASQLVALAKRTFKPRSPQDA